MSIDTPRLEMTLEVVMLPVSDIERAKDFYVNKIGFNLDHDVTHGEVRIVQLTPHTSGCSIVFGSGMKTLSEMQPGSLKGTHLVVKNIEHVRNVLQSRGVHVGEIEDMGGGIKYASFSDPDGNSWALQEIGSRATA